jgi:hypothetical protein
VSAFKMTVYIRIPSWMSRLAIATSVTLKD